MPDPSDEDGKVTAARELVEELLGLSGEAALEAATALLKEAEDAHALSGPFGVRTDVHLAYTLDVEKVRSLQSVEACLSRFTPNRECVAAALFPIADLDGNSTTLKDLSGQ